MRNWLIITIIVIFGCAAQFLVLIQTKEPPKKPESYDYHRKHVCLDNNQIAKLVDDIILGEEPRWITADDLKADKYGYLWISRKAWAYPPDTVTNRWVKIEADIRGFNVVAPFKKYLGDMKAEHDITPDKYVPVVNLSYEK